MEKWGLGYEELSKINPRLIMIRVSGYGQTGPYAGKAGYGSIGEAMGGLRYVVGDPSTPPPDPSDLPWLQRSGRFFARKFDNSDVLDRIDADLLTRA